MVLTGGGIAGGGSADIGGLNGRGGDWFVVEGMRLVRRTTQNLSVGLVRWRGVSGHSGELTRRWGKGAGLLNSTEGLHCRGTGVGGVGLLVEVDGHWWIERQRGGLILR